MSRFYRLHSGKYLCFVCAREMSRRAAKFHALRCRARPLVTGRVVSDGRTITEERM